MSIMEDMKDYQTGSGSSYQVFPKLRSDNYFSWCASMELVLRSLNQWEVVMGTYTPPVHAVEKLPLAEELQLEKAWELHKECAYMEINLQVEDKECVSIRTNHDPVVSWNTLSSIYGNRMANTQAALLVEISHI